MEKFGYAIGFIATIVLGSLWSAYVFTILWQWFMVDGLSLPPITIPIAGGISAIYGMLAVSYRGKDTKTGELVAFAVTKPLVCLAFGYAYKLFM